MRVAGGCQSSEVGGPQLVTGGDDQLRGNDVLSERTDMAPGRHRRPQSNGLPLWRLNRLDVLDRDDGVRPSRQGVAGVDVGGLFAQPQIDRRALAGAVGLSAAHGVSVHGRGVIVRDRAPGPHRLGRDAAQSAVHRDRFRLERLPTTFPLEGLDKPAPGLVQRDVGEVHSGVGRGFASQRGSHRLGCPRAGRSYRPGCGSGRPLAPG